MNFEELFHVDISGMVFLDASAVDESGGNDCSGDKGKSSEGVWSNTSLYAYTLRND